MAALDPKGKTCSWCHRPAISGQSVFRAEEQLARMTQMRRTRSGDFLLASVGDTFTIWHCPKHAYQNLPAVLAELDKATMIRLTAREGSK